MIALSSKPAYIHATAIIIGEAGILIRGPSRAGKSSLALALLAAAARLSCFGRLVGDDRVSVEPIGDTLMMRGHPEIQGKIEQRGHGILDVPWVASAIAHIVIELLPAEARAAPAAAVTRIQGVELPLLTLPAQVSINDRAALVMKLARDMRNSRECRG